MIRTVSRADIENLKLAAWASPRKRERIVLHDTTDDPLQQMVIALSKDSYIRAHRHPKAETYHLIEGLLHVQVFDEHGQWRARYTLSAEQPVIRIPAGTYHAPEAASEIAVYHEVYPGPWSKERDVEYAVWMAKEAA